MLKDNLLTLLRNDAALMALLPGGIHGDEQNSNSLAQEAINRQDTPEAFDANLELQPCALLNMETDVHYDIVFVAEAYQNAYRTCFRITFYLDPGAARERVFTLLNMITLPADKVWEVSHADDVLDQYDDVLKAPIDVSRYQLVRLR